MGTNDTSTDENTVDFLLSIINPFGFSPIMFLGFILFKHFAQMCMDASMELSLSFFKVPILPSRTPPIMKGLQELEAKDMTYLGINQMLETVFILNFFHYSFNSETIDLNFPPKDLTFQSLLTTIVVPWYAMMYLNDFVYYFWHRFMHLPAVYAWIHKHHHRQALPKRGYLDAANETPIEQFGGEVIIYFALYFVTQFWSFQGWQLVNIFAPMAYLGLFSTMALLNHTRYDLEFPWFLMSYGVKHHETHHRFGKVNYAQNTMFFDKMLGTFKKYTSGQKEA